MVFLAACNRGKWGMKRGLGVEIYGGDPAVTGCNQRGVAVATPTERGGKGL